MSGNFLLEGVRATDGHIKDIIWGLGPGQEKYKLKKGNDGKHRWPTTKVLNMPKIGLTIKIIGQDQIDALQGYRARVVANTSDARSVEELNAPLRPITLQSQKEKEKIKGEGKEDASNQRFMTAEIYQARLSGTQRSGAKAVR